MGLTLRGGGMEGDGVAGWQQVFGGGAGDQEAACCPVGDAEAAESG